MSLTRLQSHKNPDLMLQDHVRQVFSAMQGIWTWHSDRLLSPQSLELCQTLARLHDLGKGCRGFQDYIADPDTYHRDRLEKSHTPLSLLLCILKARAEHWDPLKTLMICQCVYGHHGGFSLLPHRDGTPALTRTLDRFASGEMYRILCRQMETLDWEALEYETGTRFPPFKMERQTVREAGRFLKKIIFPELTGLTIQDALEFRLKTQLMFSILLEADKAYLAVENPEHSLQPSRRVWKSAWIDRLIGQPRATPLNEMRRQARLSVQAKIKASHDVHLNSLTAPTGLGKTLLAAEWAFRNREHQLDTGHTPSKVIIVLPYLSIIEQTTRMYRKLLTYSAEKADGSWFLASNSLSDRVYDPELDSGTESFFIDTWRTELVVTTYDQFLMSLIDPRSRYQMRFHNLCDAMIIMDEVQSIPCRLWQLLNGVFQALVQTGNSKILLMSATLPPFVSDTLPLLEDYPEYFRFNRYCFSFHLKKPQTIDAFCQDILDRLPIWSETRERVLITLNTRKSARRVFDSVKMAKREKELLSGIPVYFISADVTPGDRQERISKIASGEPCLVVSTQCVEAGVDLDMHRVIRDFAPWDSLVQIAGRCNREGNRETGQVEVVDLENDNQQRFSEMIYDPVHLSITRRLLEDLETLTESRTLSLSDSYYQHLNEAKDTGKNHIEKYAYWEEDTPVHELLRGKTDQHTFVVAEKDEGLLEAMEQAKRIYDRWKRREAWRKLAGRIANVSVSVYARYGFKPEHIATEKMGHYLLHPGYYDEESGLRLESQYSDDSCNSLIF